jgi:hypothetical protein
MTWLIWLCPALLLIYALPACYYDLKYREMPKWFWAPLYAIGIPVTVYLYLTGEYLIGALCVGILLTAIYFILMVFGNKCLGAFGGIIQGADFMYLMAINLFFVITPRGNPIASLAFPLYLIASIVLVASLIFAAKWYLENGASKYEFTGIRQAVKQLEQQPAFMIQISLALVFTMVFA